MARLTERPENADLPKPELNPLVNPLLADNMGRWAEVYFTSPPEKREEAVIELLHDLEREHSGGEKKSTGPDSTETFAPLRQVPPQPDFNIESHAPQTFCAACGHENPVAHQFCGMCGAKMNYQAPPDFSHYQEPPRPPDNEHHDAEHGDPAENTTEDRRQEPSYYSASDLSLFQSFRGVRPEDDWEYEEPSSKPYRFYIAAVLAIVICVLGYMAWKGTQATQSAHEVSPAPPAPVTESTPPSANKAASPANEPAAVEPAPLSKTEGKPARPTGSTAATPAPQPHRTDVARRTPAPQPPPETSQPTADYGSQELVMAEHFLAGGNGHGRDSAEAAKWLWKAMAKHNGEASVLLADLYLKGDGVSKNCDQGRVLLDSAARRGIPGAGERLRNLQAFGCH